MTTELIHWVVWVMMVESVTDMILIRESKLVYSDLRNYHALFVVIKLTFCYFQYISRIPV